MLLCDRFRSALDSGLCAGLEIETLFEYDKLIKYQIDIQEHNLNLLGPQ